VPCLRRWEGGLRKGGGEETIRYTIGKKGESYTKGHNVMTKNLRRWVVESTGGQRRGHGKRKGS